MGCPMWWALIATPGSSGQPAGVISPVRSYASGTAWESKYTSVRPGGQIKNAFVERFHRSLGEECLDKHRPTDLGQVREVTAAYRQHYNEERPNQAITCGNRPPRVAFPQLPVRPAVPLWVDPDDWVLAVHGEHYARKVGPDGCVKLGGHRYYIQKDLAGKHVALEVDAPARELVVWHRKAAVKRLALKGLCQRLLAFDEYVDQLAEEARTEWRRLGAALRARRQRRLAGK